MNDEEFDCIHDAGTRAAALRLKGALLNSGLRSSPASGAVSAARLYDKLDRYVFAISPARSHLRFYLRWPALRASPDLRAGAKARFGERSRENPAGEVIVTVRSPQEAESLLEWLTPQLPLPN